MAMSDAASSWSIHTTHAGGADTSTNMDVNEVSANRALELGGHARGDYARISPTDDVNKAQSTNDTYPTALKLALHRALTRLTDEMAREDVETLLQPARLAGADTSDPPLTRDYRRDHRVRE
jgi:aspartate ammonia-lyase